MRIVAVSFILSLLTVSKQLGAQTGLRLWYDKPATEWVEALPVGNGHIGGMVFGRVEEELIQLNESTLYSGGPVKQQINPDAFQYLAPIREALLKEQDYSKANELAKKMQGYFTESYLPLGDLLLKQSFNGRTPAAYHRELNIQTAIATTRFTVGGVQYTREVFCTAPANVMVIRIRASVPGALDLSVALKTPLHYTVSAKANSEVIMSGKAPAHVDPSYYNPKDRQPVIYEDTAGCNGMRFQCRVKAITKTGTIRADTSGLRVQHATELVLIVSA
ncbi:MAG: glycoside hydrolase N-terminal domain-containing protein, partial [Niastella sp.]|uniref:glycoside hydrolase family 95 protein n=1 Tax=Niastella sp. TaxID=1869183 RepID=UPI00389A2A68